MLGSVRGVEVVADYAFRPFVERDLALVEAWLRAPEVVRWWGEPSEQAALLREDLTEPRMVMRIICFRGRPFAYAQDYDVAVWPQPQFAGLPAGARAIDSFIGEPEMTGCGHGGVYLRLLARQLTRDGASAVAIDPDARNIRARRAYEKAGFREAGQFDSASSSLVLMIFEDHLA